MFEALEMSFKEKEEDIVEEKITPYFKSFVSDYLKCLECQNEKVRNDPYLDFQLHIDEGNSIIF